MTGKQSDTGKEIQRDPSVKIADYCLHHLFHEIPVDLEEGSCAYSIGFFARLIRQCSLADGVFWQLACSFSACAFSKECDSLDLWRFCLQGGRELTHLRLVRRKINLPHPLGVCL